MMDSVVIGTIYIARHKINGKCYVGQTHREVGRRLNEHFKDPRRHHAFDSATKKYGLSAFDIITIDGIPSELLDQWESFFISALNTLAPHGYNLTTGGNGGLRSEETKKKLSVIFTGTTHRGRRVTEEQKRKQSETLKGRKQTPEQIEKMRLTKIGVPRSPHAREAIRRGWEKRRLLYGPGGGNGKRVQF
jgi:group I intron endonuclease